MLQDALVKEMKVSRLTVQTASEFLGYGHKSSVSRALAKPNMSALDAIKIMALCSTESIDIPGGLHIVLKIRTSNDVLKMKVCDELFAAFRNEVFVTGHYRKYLQGGCTWADVADESDDYNDEESIRKSWIHLATPVSLVMTVLKVTKLEEITVQTKAGDSLTIGIK